MKSVESRSHWPLTALSSITSIANMLLPLVLVRLLSPAEIGTFKIFFLYLMILPAFGLTAGVLSGLAYWAGRESAQERISASGALMLGSGLLCTLIGIVFHHHIAAYFGWEPGYALLFACSIFGALAANFFEEAAIASGKIWTGALFNSAFELSRTVLTLLTAWYTRSLLGILVVHTCMTSLKVIVGYLLGSYLKLFSLSFRRETLRQVWNYAFPVSLAWMFGVFATHADQLILSTFIDAETFALYAIGCLMIPPLFMLEQAVTRVLIPQMSAAFESGKTYRAAAKFKESVRTLGFFYIPAVAGLIVFAEPIIELLFTERYSQASGYLQLFALSYLSFIIPNDALARSRGDARWILKNFVIFSVVALSFAFGLTRIAGPYGALWALLLTRFFMRLYVVLYMRAECSWSLPSFLPLNSLGRCTALALVLSILSLSLRPAFDSELLWFLVTGPAFGIIYLVAGIYIENVYRVDAQSEPRVLMITQNVPIGGLERMVLDLCRTLKRSRGWTVCLFAYDQKDDCDESLLGSFRDDQIPVVTYQKGKGFSIGVVFALLRAIYQHDITHLHSHHIGGLIYGVLARVLSLGRVQLIHTQHSFIHLEDEERYALYERLFTPFVDELTIVSETLRNTYEELGLNKDRIHLIENGVQFGTSPALSWEERRNRREHLITSYQELSAFKDSYWILYLARLHPVKGQRDAIRLWSALDPHTRQSSVLLLVGPESHEGEQRRLEERIKRAPDNDRILLLGGTYEPQRWLDSADLYLSCSRFEGMPLGPVEALGSGLPLALSKIPGHRFLADKSVQLDLEDMEQSALEIDKLALLGGRILPSNYPDLRSSLEKVREQFSLEAMATRYAELYSQGRRRHVPWDLLGKYSPERSVDKVSIIN